jgi:hypothetical protein
MNAALPSTNRHHVDPECVRELRLTRSESQTVSLEATGARSFFLLIHESTVGDSSTRVNWRCSNVTRIANPREGFALAFLEDSPHGFDDGYTEGLGKPCGNQEQEQEPEPEPEPEQEQEQEQE